MSGFDALAVPGISKEEVVLIVEGDEGSISIASAPVFGDEIDLGALSYGEALLKRFNNGELSKKIAAVTPGIGAFHTRFGIVSSLFFDKRRNRMRSKQAGRGDGTVMRFNRLRAVIVRSSLPRVRASLDTTRE